MIECRQIVEEDFDNFETPDYGFAYAKPDITLGKTLAFRKGVTLLSLIGVVPLWKGVGQLWMLVSKEVSKYPLELVKKQVEELEKVAKENNYHRIHAIVPKEERYIKWAKLHGFFHESNMLFAGPDTNHMSMVAYIPDLN